MEEKAYKCGHLGCPKEYTQKQNASRHGNKDDHPNHYECFRKNGSSKCKLCKKRSENLKRLLEECNVLGGNWVENAEILRPNPDKWLACIHTCDDQHNCIPTKTTRSFSRHRASAKRHPDCHNDPDCPGHKYIAKVIAIDSHTYLKMLYSTVLPSVHPC
jgi:hypothetical protein